MTKGAPKGNQFWKLRSKHGRDKIFKTPELMLEAASEYFQWCEDNPFYEVVLSKNYSKPFKDANGEVYFPPNTENLPKMRPFTMQGLCIFLGVNTVYFNQFEEGLKGKDDETSKDFSKIVTHIRDIIYNQKYSGAASGFLNPNIIARDLGLSDTREIKGGLNISKYESLTDAELELKLQEMRDNMEK